MENATKALLMAGGILIALMLLVLVVYSVREWGDVQEAQFKEENAQVVAEFNKSYLSYEKKVYGSELLGLVNKMLDYNVSKDVTVNDYTPMDMKVHINGTADDLFTNNKEYDLEDISERITEALDATLDNPAYSNLDSSYWERLAKSSSDWNSFDNLCTALQIDPSINRNNLQIAAQEYYKYVQFKRLKFECTGTTFSDSGRVASMTFVQQ